MITRATYGVLFLLSLSLTVSCDEGPPAAATANSKSAEELFLDGLAHRFPETVRNGNFEVAERMSRLYFDVAEGKAERYSGRVLPMGAILNPDHKDETLSILVYAYYATSESVPAELRLVFGNGDAVSVRLSQQNHRLGDHGFIRQGSVQIDLKEFLGPNIADGGSVTVVPIETSGQEGEPVSIDLLNGHPLEISR